MRCPRFLFLLVTVAGVLTAGPAGANAEREAMMLSALLSCDVTYASEPYASHVATRDLADLDLAHGALQAHLARAFGEREAQLLMTRTALEGVRARPGTNLPPTAAVTACRRIASGAINAYGWSHTWQAWIERN